MEKRLEKYRHFVHRRDDRKEGAYTMEISWHMLNVIYLMSTHTVAKEAVVETNFRIILGKNRPTFLCDYYLVRRWIFARRKNDRISLFFVIGEVNVMQPIWSQSCQRIGTSSKYRVLSKVFQARVFRRAQVKLLINNISTYTYSLKDRGVGGVFLLLLHAREIYRARIFIYISLLR